MIQLSLFYVQVSINSFIRLRCVKLDWVRSNCFDDFDVLKMKY